MIQQENTSTRLVSSDPSPVSTSLLSTLVSGKGSHKDKVLPLKHPVRQALEKYATVIGPLDASQVINELEDDNLCLFFSYYKELQILHLKNWSNLSFPVIRTMCMTFGENLRELDVSSSLINSSHIELLLAYSHDLKIIRLDNCPQVDANAIKNIVKLSYRTLQELYLVNCKKLNTEAFQLIGGYVGNISKNMAKNKTALSRTSHSLSLSSISNPNPNSYIPPSLSSPLTKLKALDLTNTSLNDNGLLSIAYGCKNIVFLNICDCFNITDKSLTNLIENNKKIQLLNCKNCKNITNLSAKYIGKYLNNLMSLNLSYCSNITDVGIKMISQGCLKLQAVNLIYLNQITDLSLFHLVTNCKILMYLNITGCEQITVNGVKNLIMGLPYVELSKSYLGFKPIDNYLEKKLEDCLNMIEYNQIQEINKQLLAQELKEEQELEIYNNLLNKSASIIQGAIFRYTKRLFFYNIWQSKLKTSSTITIQRIYRGYRGRLESHKRRKDVEKFYALSPFALKIQKHVRGHLSRVKISHNSANQDNEQVSLVSQTIREMYFIRKKEVENAIAVRLQAIFRGFLTRLHFRVYKKLDKRHKSHLHSAAIIIQCLIRSFLAKNLFKKLKLNKKNEEEAIRIASLKIKLFCVAGMKRYKSRLQGDELKRFFREKWTAAIEIQRFYRGYYAREAVNIMLINKAIEYKAATLIQKVWRGSRVLHWKAQRLNLLAGFVLDRHYNERKAAVNSSRKRWIEFIRETRHDSASEEEDENQENEYPYIEYFDTGRKQKYWVNYLTNETTYDEPPIPFAHELDLIGKRIKIFWTVQGTWYEGTIGDFKKKKKKHLVNYDDGDHEWIILENEADRVQIQLPDGTWSMVSFFLLNFCFISNQLIFLLFFSILCINHRPLRKRFRNSKIRRREMISENKLYRMLSNGNLSMMTSPTKHSLFLLLLVRFALPPSMATYGVSNWMQVVFHALLMKKLTKLSMKIQDSLTRFQKTSFNREILSCRSLDLPFTFVITLSLSIMILLIREMDTSTRILKLMLKEMETKRQLRRFSLRLLNLQLLTTLLPFCLELVNFTNELVFQIRF